MSDREEKIQKRMEVLLAAHAANKSYWGTRRRTEPSKKEKQESRTLFLNMIRSQAEEDVDAERPAGRSSQEACELRLWAF